MNREISDLIFLSAVNILYVATHSFCQSPRLYLKSLYCCSLSTITSISLPSPQPLFQPLLLLPQPSLIVPPYLPFPPQSRSKTTSSPTPTSLPSFLPSHLPSPKLTSFTTFLALYDCPYSSSPFYTPFHPTHSSLGHN